MGKHDYHDRPITALTFDTDNCPELAIEFVQNRLNQYNIPGSFFCTQRYKSLKKPHEAAVHPFLKEFFKLDEMFGPLNQLKEVIPEAVGNRCHQLTCNGALYRYLGETGFLYDSAWPMYLHENIAPIRLHSGIYELPIFYVENLIFEHGMNDLFLSRLRSPGIKVFLFHPVHLFHNSTRETFFEIMKIPYSDRYRDELVSDGDGVLTFFDQLLGLLNREQILCKTCCEIARNEKSV